jgi:hypothetical protein
MSRATATTRPLANPSQCMAKALQQVAGGRRLTKTVMHLQPHHSTAAMPWMGMAAINS